MQNVGETVVEGVKHAVESGGSNIGESVSSVSSDVGERLQNVGETVVEGVKNSVKTEE